MYNLCTIFAIEIICFLVDKDNLVRKLELFMDPATLTVQLSDLSLRRSDEEVLKDFRETTEAFTKFKHEVAVISGYVFQRSAQIGTVKTEHMARHDTLVALAKKLNWNFEETLYKYIPLLQDPRNVVLAFIAMMKLEVICYPLREQYDELVAVLPSPLHHQALELYKTKKKACKEIPPGGFDRLTALFVDVHVKVEQTIPELSNKSAAIVRQTAALYQALLRFIIYTAGKHKPVIQEPEPGALVIVDYDPATQQLASRVDSFVERVRETKNKITEAVATILGYSRKAKTLEDAVLRDTVRPYIEGSDSEKLHKEDQFRNGQLKVGYKEVENEVNALTNISKGISRLKATLERRLGTLSDLQIGPDIRFTSLALEKSHYATLLIGFELLIEEQEQHLERKPISQRVHAPGYYAAKLRENLRLLRLYINQFNAFTGSSFSPLHTSTRRLFDYLRLPTVGGLYETLKVQISPPVANNSTFGTRLRPLVYQTITGTLKKHGPRTLALTDNEQSVVQTIRSRRPFENPQDGLPTSVRYFLMKSFMMNVYFSPKVDPEFEVTLQRLHRSSLYAASFAATLNRDLEFQEYLAVYLKATDMETFSPEIRLMAEAVEIATQEHHGNALTCLLTYCRVRQILATLQQSAKEKTSQQHQDRLNWVETSCWPFLKEQEQNLPKYFARFGALEVHTDLQHDLDPTFYQHLVQALFCDDPSIKRDASTALINLMRLLPYEDLPKDYQIQMLLQAWVLENLRTRLYDIPHGATLLNKLFVEYLTNSNVRHMWRQCYDTGTTESALAKVATRKEADRGGPFSELYKVISRTRNAEDYALWKAVATLYDSFRELLYRSEERTVGSPTYQKADQLIQGVQDAFGTIPQITNETEEQTHLGIARFCLNEMREQFKRFTV
jgi:hypothetical protein